MSDQPTPGVYPTTPAPHPVDAPLPPRGPVELEVPEGRWERPAPVERPAETSEQIAAGLVSDLYEETHDVLDEAGAPKGEPAPDRVRWLLSRYREAVERAEKAAELAEAAPGRRWSSALVAPAHAALTTAGVPDASLPDRIAALVAQRDEARRDAEETADRLTGAELALIRALRERDEAWAHADEAQGAYEEVDRELRAARAELALLAGEGEPAGGDGVVDRRALATAPAVPDPLRATAAPEETPEEAAAVLRRDRDDEWAGRDGAEAEAGAPGEARHAWLSSACTSCGAGKGVPCEPRCVGAKAGYSCDCPTCAPASVAPSPAEAEGPSEGDTPEERVVWGWLVEHHRGRVRTGRDVRDLLRRLSALREPEGERHERVIDHSQVTRLREGQSVLLWPPGEPDEQRATIILHAPSAPGSSGAPASASVPAAVATASGTASRADDAVATPEIPGTAALTREVERAGFTWDEDADHPDFPWRHPESESSFGLLGAAASALRRANNVALRSAPAESERAEQMRAEQNLRLETLLASRAPLSQPESRKPVAYLRVYPEGEGVIAEYLPSAENLPPGRYDLFTAPVSREAAEAPKGEPYLWALVNVATGARCYTVYGTREEADRECAAVPGYYVVALYREPPAEPVGEPADRFSAALEWAARAHAGQVYETADGPEPYVLHCLRVALAVPTKSGRIVALLHDVLEDTDAGLPPWLTDHERHAVEMLKRNKNADYAGHIRWLSEKVGADGTVAKQVKIADLRENLSHIRPGHRENLRERYEAALRALGAEVPPVPPASNRFWAPTIAEIDRAHHRLDLHGIPRAHADTEEPYTLAARIEMLPHPAVPPAGGWTEEERQIIDACLNIGIPNMHAEKAAIARGIRARLTGAVPAAQEGENG